ncbi:MAG TPA: hypothetical protein PKD75_10545 [Tepidiformaceae bacterium]|nr:hypothetical protein [Tepidiformaceae bacterium]
MPAENIPAKPLEKLFTRMEQAQQFGKAFDEALERRVLGLPPVEGREAILIAEDPRRQTMTQKEDIAGLRELEKEVREQGEVAVAQRLAESMAENQRLRAQVAELSGKPDDEIQRPAPVIQEGPGPQRANVELPEGTPTKDWTVKQMLEFCRANSLPLPPKGGVGMKHLAVLDHVIGELNKVQSSD